MAGEPRCRPGPMGGGLSGKDRGAALKERDELYEPAIEVIIREGRGSCSLLQRALAGWLTPLWPAAPGGGRQGGRERLEQPPERDALVSLAREEHAVDGGQPEVRQLVSGRAVRVVTEGGGPVAHEPASSARSRSRLPDGAASRRRRGAGTQRRPRPAGRAWLELHLCH